jgi:predicted nucleic acid-binding Zn ribbon protein
MKKDDERVALQAVEFWSTVCEEECELILEAQEVRRARIAFTIGLTHHPGPRVR